MERWREVIAQMRAEREQVQDKYDRIEVARYDARTLDALEARLSAPTPEVAPGTCALCGEPMPPGEEMFKFHGYSGPCPQKK